MQPHQVDALSQDVQRVLHWANRFEREPSSRRGSRYLEQLENAVSGLLSGIQLLRSGQVPLQPAYTTPMYLLRLPEFSGWDLSSTTIIHPDKLAQREIISQGFARTQAEMYRVKECIDENIHPAQRLGMSTIEFNMLARQHNRFVAAFGIDLDLKPLKNIRTSVDIWPFPLRVENISEHRSEMLVGVLQQLGIDVNTRNSIREYIIYVFKKVIGVEVRGT